MSVGGDVGGEDLLEKCMVNSKSFISEVYLQYLPAIPL